MRPRVHTGLAETIAEVRSASTDHRPTDAAACGAPPGRPDQLEEAVAAQTGSLRSELFEALLSEVRLEVARRIPPARATRDQSAGTCAQLVRNSRTKCVHMCAMSPDSGRPPSEWTSLCGWDFGRWGGFTLVGGPSSRITCERCDSFAQGRIPDEQL